MTLSYTGLWLRPKLCPISCWATVKKSIWPVIVQNYDITSGLSLVNIIDRASDWLLTRAVVAGVLSPVFVLVKVDVSAPVSKLIGIVGVGQDQAGAIKWVAGGEKKTELGEENCVTH